MLLLSDASTATKSLEQALMPAWSHLDYKCLQGLLC